MFRRFGGNLSAVVGVINYAFCDFVFPPCEISQSLVLPYVIGTICLPFLPATQRIRKVYILYSWSTTNGELRHGPWELQPRGLEQKPSGLEQKCAELLSSVI